MVSITHYKRSIFVAIDSKLARELLVSVLQADSETRICPFVPDGTEPTLWKALYNYFVAEDFANHATFVILETDAPPESAAHRLLLEFPGIKVITVNSVTGDVLMVGMQPKIQADCFALPVLVNLLRANSHESKLWLHDAE